jgi:hypothetical protein
MQASGHVFSGVFFPGNIRRRCAGRILKSMAFLKKTKKLKKLKKLGFTNTTK